MNVYHVTGSPCPKPNLMRLLIATIISFFGRPQFLSAQLKAGDEIPAAIWTAALKVTNHPDGKATVKLADYKDKLIVLDFWATWCTSCIKKFPELYTLQMDMKDSVMVLLVNSVAERDDLRSVANFLKKRSAAYRFTSIVEDTLLSSYFPHDGVPHYILLKNGKVMHVIGARDVATTGLREIIAGGGAVVPGPVFDYDFRQPLFLNGNGGQRPAYVYGSVLTRYLPGVMGGISSNRDDNGLTCRLTFINTRIIDLLRAAYPEFSEISRARTVLKLADTSLLPETGRDEDILYTYEIEMPSMPYTKARQLMQQDLERYFSLSISCSKQAMPCWVLKAVNPQKALQAAKDQPRETNMQENLGIPVYYTNDKLDNLLRYLEEINNIPFIDETGVNDPVSLKLPANLQNMQVLQDSLAAQGFKLAKANRTIDVVTIADKTNH